MYWVCDGQLDCGLNDTSDESQETCVHHVCPNSHRKCDTVNQCVPQYQFCDGVQQCLDGSDENSTINNINSGRTKDFCKAQNCGFMCKDGRCVGAKHRCDGYSDCRDGSDEQDCGGNACAQFGVCSQRCEFSKTGHPKCFCDDGYRADFFLINQCRAEGPPAKLLVAVNNQIRSVSPFTSLHHNIFAVAKSKITSMDTVEINGATYCYFATLKGTVERIKFISGNQESRSKRDVDETTPETIVSNLCYLFSLI